MPPEISLVSLLWGFSFLIFQLERAEQKSTGCFEGVLPILRPKWAQNTAVSLTGKHARLLASGEERRKRVTEEREKGRGGEEEKRREIGRREGKEG